MRETLARGPEAAEYGIHLCWGDYKHRYGDYEHRHFTVPEDLSLCVELANAVGDGAAFIHMAADRETGRDPAYFGPLPELVARRLAPGVIDYDVDDQRSAELAVAASTGSDGMEFPVATECGMARIDERPGGPSLERLLQLHAQTAAPIR